MAERVVATIDEASFVQRNLRRNFVVLPMSMGLFGLGITLASPSTILSAFATHLGASNLIIGALPGLQAIAWAIPALFAANFIDRKARKLPVLLGVTIGERLPYLLMGIVALVLAGSQPAFALALTLSLVALGSLSTGFALPTWLEVVAKVIPPYVRGRFFGFGNGLSALLGMGGALIAGIFLADFPFPTGYAFCFLAGFITLAVSYIFVALGREHPVEPTTTHASMLVYLHSLPDFLLSDSNFAFLLISRALGTGGAIGLTFYTIFALTRLGASDGDVGMFTFYMLAAQTAFTMLFGWIADRHGHKIVLMLGTIAATFGSIIAMGAQHPQQMYFAFAGTGAYMGSMAVSQFGILLGFGDATNRTTYVGLFNTLLSPLAFILQIAGGLLADRSGYGIVFEVSAATAVLSLVVLSAFVSEPQLSRGEASAEEEMP